MSWSDIILLTISSALSLVCGVFLEKYRQKRSAPKIKIYSPLVEFENQHRCYSLYYSKIFHSKFFIVRLNVENLSCTEGYLHNVSLFCEESFTGKNIFHTVSLSEIKQDEFLFNYLKSERFKNDLYFENSLMIAPFEHKTVCFVFNTYYTGGSDSEFILSYSSSGVKHKTNKIKLKIYNNIYIDNWSTMERIEDIKQFKKENPGIARERAKKYILRKK